MTFGFSPYHQSSRTRVNFEVTRDVILTNNQATKKDKKTKQTQKYLLAENQTNKQAFDTGNHEGNSS